MKVRHATTADIEQMGRNREERLFAALEAHAEREEAFRTSCASRDLLHTAQREAQDTPRVADPFTTDAQADLAAAVQRSLNRLSGRNGGSL